MVSFGAIEVRHYLSALGDHPSVSSGVPVGLSDTWESGFTGPLIEYEQNKGETIVLTENEHMEISALVASLHSSHDEEASHDKEEASHDKEEASHDKEEEASSHESKSHEGAIISSSSAVIGGVRRLKHFEKLTMMRLTRMERLRRCLDAGHSQEEIDVTVKEVNSIKLQRFESRPTSVYPDLELQIEMGFEEFTHVCKHVGSRVMTFMDIIPSSLQSITRSRKSEQQQATEDDENEDDKQRRAPPSSSSQQSSSFPGASIVTSTVVTPGCLAICSI